MPLAWVTPSRRAILPRPQTSEVVRTKFLEAPIFGHGVHTFNYTSPHGMTVPWVHNLYLEVLAEQGMLGFAALGFLMYRGFSTAWTVHRVSTAEARLLSTGALAALITFSFVAFFELSFLREWVVLTFFALLAVIARLAGVSGQEKEALR